MIGWAIEIRRSRRLWVIKRTKKEALEEIEILIDMMPNASSRDWSIRKIDWTYAETPFLSIDKINKLIKAAI